MFNGLSNSRVLVKAAWNVRQQDKELFMFPVVSAIATLIETLTFAVPSFLVFSGDSGQTSVIGYVLVFLFYLAMIFVFIFANAALIGAAMIRLRGGNPTLAGGFAIAMSHIGAIFGYTVISATVGIILHALSGGDRKGQASIWLGLFPR